MLKYRLAIHFSLMSVTAGAGGHWLLLRGVGTFSLQIQENSYFYAFALIGVIRVVQICA